MTSNKSTHIAMASLTLAIIWALTGCAPLKDNVQPYPPYKKDIMHREVWEF
jgi:hypothetical protein